MNNKIKPTILVVDDDQDNLALIELLLTKNNYNIVAVESGIKALEVISNTKPDLILLDIMMPEMNGYEVCARLQKNKEYAFIPVMFVTALGEEQNKAKAFSVGAVDYLVKPIKREILLEKVQLHLNTNVRWKELFKESPKSISVIMASDFIEFKEYLSSQLNLTSDKKYRLDAMTYSDIYMISDELEISNEEMAQYIAEFLKLPFTSYIDPENVELGSIPVPFCRANLVVAVKESKNGKGFVLSNPFNLELMDILDKLRVKGESLKISIAQPKSIKALLATDDKMTSFENVIMSEDRDKSSKVSVKEEVIEPTTVDIEKSPVIYIANNILYTAVSEKASDVHIEPKKNNTVVRFRIDGDMREMFALERKTGPMLINRFKIIAGMDISERRKPQDGSSEAVIDNRKFKLRLATTSTPDGESLIIRLLEPYAKPKTLSELGMTEEQVKTMVDVSNQSQGLILFVGATGSGKTTTVYSLLSQIDCQLRSLISVEDPVEYRLPYANQQQVNVKAGVTFEALLKSSVRQDPDIIFLGEIRDQYSAKMSVDFASTGHLTVSTLHTSNTTTAIFRLERLGVTRSVMAEALLCVVAQKLLKKLCPDCKKISQITKKEKEMLSPFTDEIPSKLAKPLGCPKCHNTGYRGRDGVYEVLRFSPEITGMVREGKPISEIRDRIREGGSYLIVNHAIEKVRNHTFSLEDVYRDVLVEEMKLTMGTTKKREQVVTAVKEEKVKKASILIVDDDEDILSLVKTIFGTRGYEITTATDGVDAIVDMSRKEYDLIISDVDMPNLDGFRLLDIKNQKGIQTPVMFLTSRTDSEDELKGLELGAIDYIKKPITKKILLLRIENFFKKRKKEV